MNYRFDIDEWLTRCPLESKYGRFSGEIITSPCHICNNEHLRREARDKFVWGPAVPVDVFVMAEGEPPDRHVTKIGGLPYRPARSPWPTTEAGTPMSFLAQIDLTDSKDLVGELPGDVLAVFTPDSDNYIESLHFEWQRLGLKEVVSPEEVPEQAWRPDPCYGHICRTVSYPEGEEKLDSPASKYPLCRGLEIWSSYHLLQYQATQIGSAPSFIQPGADQLPGQRLCAISSVQPAMHEPYPWVNRSEPRMAKDERRYDDSYFMLCDVGCIYISIDEGGQLHYGWSCY